MAMDVADILNREVFEVDAIACMRVADIVREYTPSSTPVQHAARSPSEYLAFKIASTAICHQINWDFLHVRLAKLFLNSSPTRLSERLATLRTDELASSLSGYPKPERLKLKERTSLLRDVGRILEAKYGGDPLALVRAAGGHLSGQLGFRARLDDFRAYRTDPLRKKSAVLVQELLREGTLFFEDDDTIAPAVDYHLIRLYLRTGRVVPLYNAIADELSGRPRPRARLIKLLREAVSDGVRLTASYAGLSVAALNYVEWQIGRSICHRKTPACQSGPTSKTLDPDVGALFTGACPFIEFCPACSDPGRLKLREPVYTGSYY